MKHSLSICYIIIIILITSCLSYAQEERVLFSEPFNDLDNWEPLYFKKIKEHTTYSIIKDGDQSYLRAESNASASGIVCKNEFNMIEHPHMRWRWKINNVYKKGDAATREGDDYPIRLYVMFKYDPDKASFGKKFKYGLAKKMYGTYPPQSTLNYIWANRKHEGNVVTSPYAKESKLVILQSGPESAGTWIIEDVNIIDDYRRIFGTDPPEQASIAIMNDSDNTGESSVSYMDYIEVYK
ncbi:MAG: DUF3047 domain-containing protein [Nitrospiraceae bacterium]|nr:MAG: DUF3047 domain-containing protein [Nitrospiraceae bacterium]